MSSPSQLRGASSARFLLGCATLGGLLMGVLVLAGWAWNIPAARALLLGRHEIAPNTALGLILAAVSLGLLHARPLSPARRAVGTASTCALLLLGALTLLVGFFALPWDFQNLLLWWREPSSQPPAPLTAPSTACCFLLLGGSLLLLERRVAAPAWLMDTPLVLVLLIALFEFNGRLHGALTPTYFHEGMLREGMGLHTSLMLMLLGTGVACARPERGLMGQLTRDTLGGFLARRLVPVSILGPTLVGVTLELLHREEFFSLPTKAALFSTVMSLGGVAIVFLSAQALNRIDNERRQADASLKASEERFRGLLETAPDAVISVDAAGRVRFMNAEAEHLFGYSREELLGQDVGLLVPELLREADRHYREKYMAAPTAHRMNPELPLYGRHKSGAELPVEVNLSPFSTPEGLIVTAIIRDVTEHERYLEGLRAARAEAERERALLEAVVEHAPVGILFLEPAQEKLRFNSALEGMLGENLHGSAGHQHCLECLRHADGQPVRIEELPSTRALEGHEVPPEKYWIVREQRRIPVLASAAPVRGPLGEVRGMIVCVQDITPHEELERLREEYVGLISHDLRTPLQNIILRCQQLLRSLQAKGLEAEVAAADALLRNTRRMNGMVEELLESSRLESGQVELHREPVELSRFLEEVIERGVPPDARERLRLEAITPSPWLLVDAPRLERVLVNLLTNALKYSEPGTPVQVRLEPENGQVRVSVRDQGKGLRPEETARLFTKYYRTREGQRADGIGLGLYISRLIIEAHGGHIQVTSTPGEGSTFSFTLPLSATAPQVKRPGPPPMGEGSPPPSS